MNLCPMTPHLVVTTVPNIRNRRLMFNHCKITVSIDVNKCSQIIVVTSFDDIYNPTFRIATYDKRENDKRFVRFTVSAY